MKRKLAVVAVLLVLILALSPMASALEPRASEYFSCYSASLHAKGNGKVEVSYSVTGTGGDMDKIGVSSITIYKADGTEVDSFGYLDKGYENLTAYDTWCMDDAITFQGVSGVKYYARLVFYVVKGDGSDYRYYTTNTVTA